MKSKKIFGVVLALVMALSLGLLAACGNNVPATDISIDSASLELIVGDSDTLTASVEPSDSTDEITWSVNADGTSVISLSATSGSSVTVTAKSAGSATITATAGEQTATCSVTVKIADITVDTADALIAAVANTANAGKTIYIENGNYSLPSQVRIAQDITIIGESEEGVVLKPAEGWTNDTGSKGVSSVITVTAGADANISNLTVQDAATLAMTNGSDYAHGINVAQAGNVVISNVTAKNNDGVGVLVNDSVVTLKNVATSGNGWGGVNIDVVGRDWSVPSVVLTVDDACAFGEQMQIYCDDAQQSAALEGKVKVPESYNQDAIETVIPVDGGENDVVRYVWSADAALNTASKVVVGVAAGGYSNLSLALAEMEDGAALYLQPGTYESDIEIAAKNVSVIGSGTADTIINGYIEFNGDTSAGAGSDSSNAIYSVSNVSVVADSAMQWAIGFEGSEKGTDVTLNVSDCVIDGYVFGVNFATYTESQVNVSNVTFNDVWCAVAVGHSDSNAYAIENCDIAGDGEYILQLYYFEDGSLAENKFYREVGGQAEKASTPSTANWWAQVNGSAQA